MCKQMYQLLFPDGSIVHTFHLFYQLLNKLVLSPFCVPGTTLSTGDTEVIHPLHLQGIDSRTPTETHK